MRYDGVSFLYISVSRRTGEITFIGVMGHKENQPELIILDAEGYLCAVSQNCIDAFQSGSDSDLTEDNFMRLIRRWVHAQG